MEADQPVQIKEFLALCRAASRLQTTSHFARIWESEGMPLNLLEGHRV